MSEPIVRPSTVTAGFLEVSFAARPPRTHLDELRAAGFRWDPRTRSWYGPATRLPARLAQKAGAA